MRGVFCSASLFEHGTELLCGVHVVSMWCCCRHAVQVSPGAVWFAGHVQSLSPAASLVNISATYLLLPADVDADADDLEVAAAVAAAKRQATAAAAASSTRAGKPMAGAKSGARGAVDTDAFLAAMMKAEQAHERKSAAGGGGDRLEQPMSKKGKAQQVCVWLVVTY